MRHSGRAINNMKALYGACNLLPQWAITFTHGAIIHPQHSIDYPHKVCWRAAIGCMYIIKMSFYNVCVPFDISYCTMGTVLLLHLSNCVLYGITPSLRLHLAWFSDQFKMFQNILLPSIVMVWCVRMVLFRLSRNTIWSNDMIW